MPDITINGQTHTIDAPDNMPLLWVIRDLVGLTGTRFGCGQALCGACTVHLNGYPIRSCSIPLAAAIGQTITTIEGLGSEGALHPLQEAWIAHGVPQCGYCQSGQLMSAAALLAQFPSPTDEQIDQYMSGNICRCGTYTRIRAAIKSVAESGS